MKIPVVAFDVDGTLIGQTVEDGDHPLYENIQLFLLLQRAGCEMVIWSGGGSDYASHWADKLGLKAETMAKGECRPDIAFDDEEVKLGKVNIRLARKDVIETIMGEIE